MEWAGGASADSLTVDGIAAEIWTTHGVDVILDSITVTFPDGQTANNIAYERENAKAWAEGVIDGYLGNYDVVGSDRWVVPTREEVNRDLLPHWCSGVTIGVLLSGKEYKK